MKRALIFFTLLVAAMLFASPALADFATVTPVPEGSAVDEVVLAPVDDGGARNTFRRDYTVAYIVGAVILALIVFGADTIKTRSLVAGYETFITRITEDVELADALEGGYMRLPGEARQVVDLPMDLIALLARMTPTVRDDALADFMKRIRDGTPNQ